MPVDLSRPRKTLSRSLLTFVVLALSVTGPVALSIVLAYNQAIEAQAALLHSLANSVSQRADVTADQIKAAFTQLAAVPGADKCSAAHLAVMDSSDLSASNIQAFGYIADGQLVCSSQRLPGPIPLGPVDFTSLRGAKIRFNQTFASVPGVSFVLIEHQGWVAVVNKAIVLDTPTGKSNAVIALANPRRGALFAENGNVPGNWLHHHPRSWTVPDQMFIANGYMVSVAKSKDYELMGVAAVPYSDLQAPLLKAALVMVPIGLVLGIGLGAFKLYLLRRQQSMRVQLRNAIRDHEFSVVYQPIVDLKTRRWTAAEALLRWTRRDGTNVPPDIFIPLAESAGLIREVTTELIEIVAQEAGGFYACWSDFRLALNVAAADLESGDLDGKLRKLAARVGAQPSNFSIELTERSVVDQSNLNRLLEPIRTAGIRIAIDDFGTGYSSLAYLQTFEVDCLKIDKSFVRTINSATQTTDVLDHVISLAKSLGLNMVAEGIETEAEADYLEAQGVRVAQGWLFAQPMPRDALLAGLRKQQGEVAATGVKQIAGRRRRLSARAKPAPTGRRFPRRSYVPQTPPE